MKTLISVMVSIFISMGTLKAQTVDILYFSPAGGTMHNAVLNLIDHGGIFSESPVTLSNCAQAANYLANTDKPTIAVWDIQNTALSENKACDITDYNTFITVYSQAFYNICTLKVNSDQNTIEYLKSGSARIGVFNGVVEQAQLMGIMSAFSSSSRIVPYGSTADMLAALEIGEVDFLYTARYTDTMTCVATADPYSEGGVTKLNALIDSELSESSFILVVVGVNVDQQQVHDAVKRSVQSENWTSRFPAHRSLLTAKSREEQLAVIEATLDALEENLKSRQ